MAGQGFVAKMVQPGEAIRSSEWNAALSEIVRLGQVLSRLERHLGIQRGAAVAQPRGEGVRHGAEGVRR